MDTHTPGSEHSSHEAPKPATAVPHFDKKDIDDNKVLAALSYLSILVFVPLFLKRESKYAQEHARQGLVMFIAGMVGWFTFIIPPIGLLVMVVLVILNLIAIIKCLMGEFWEVPVIGPLRKNINL